MPIRPMARWARLALPAILGFAAAAAASGQQIVYGRAIWSYQTFGTDDLSARGFHQIYDVDYQRNVADPLNLRLSFRGDGSEGNQEFSTFQTKNSIWQLRPLAELSYFLPTFHLLGRYELLDTKSTFDELEFRRKTERIYTTVGWTPEELPSLSLLGERRTLIDKSAGLDQKEDIAFETLQYQWRGLTVAQTARYSDFQPGTINFDRKTVDLQGQLRVENSIREGLVSFSGGAVGGVSRIDETGGPGTTFNVPTQVTPTATLSSRDDTPLDSRDNPMVSAPLLNDGDLKTSAGIVVGGPQALAYHNLAADMGRIVGLDTIRVYVRDSTGSLVPLGGLLRWDVYTSADGIDWRPLKTGAQSLFIGALSAYEVTFDKTTARYFKVVSFGTNSLEAFVTEVQAFFHTEFSQTQARRTDLKFVTADLNVSVRPSPWLTLHYSGLLNDFHTTQPDRPDFNSRDTDHLASVEIAPSQPWTLTARYENRTFESEGTAKQTTESLWGIAQYSANRNWTTSIEANRVDEKGIVEFQSDTLRLHEYLRLYRTIELSLDGGVGRDQFRLLDLSDQRVFVNAVSYIQLTPAIRLTLAANYQKTKFSGTGALDLPSFESTDGRYYGEIFYRPSPQLLLSGRYGYVTSQFFSGTTKAYRVEWYPFARGTVGIGTIFDEDIETNGTYRRFRRIQILPTWAVNRHLTVNVNYNYLTLLESGIVSSPTESKARQFYVTVTWIL